MGKNYFGWLFKHDDDVETFHYCTIEEYDENGYAISIPARYFIKTVRSLIKAAKTRLEHGETAQNLGVKIIFREQMQENVLCGEIFASRPLPDEPTFYDSEENDIITVEIVYNLKVFNDKMLGFANSIIRKINKFEDKSPLLDRPVRICIPDIEDNFVEFNWSGK